VCSLGNSHVSTTRYLLDMDALHGSWGRQRVGREVPGLVNTFDQSQMMACIEFSRACPYLDEACSIYHLHGGPELMRLDGLVSDGTTPCPPFRHVFVHVQMLATWAATCDLYKYGRPARPVAQGSAACVCHLPPLVTHYQPSPPPRNHSQSVS
jgi:hypothetical protein